MEQRIVAKNENQCIYFMKETNLGFYLLIPNSKQVKIVLGLFDDVTDDFVKNMPISNDKAVVIPVIQSDILKQANIINSVSYNYLEQVLSFLINTSYKILTYNHIEVEQQILLNQSSQLDAFNQNFVTKYQGRVQLFNLLPEPAPTPEISPILKQPAPVQKTALDENFENIMPTEMPTEAKKEVVIPQERTREPGFVSYVLLGVIVAVVSLVFLYFII